METKTQTPTMKRSSSSNSDAHTQLDSPHSPLRFHSPLRSDQGDPPETPPYVSPVGSPEKPPPDNSKAIVAVNKSTQFTPSPSPLQPRLPENAAAAAKSPSPVVLFNRAVREDGPQGTTKVGPASVGGSGSMNSILRRSKMGETVKMAALGFRLSEFVLCLISFSVMAADKTQGWSGDSYDRYKEYRYCLSVNIIGFVYSGFQAYSLAYYMGKGKHLIHQHLCRPFDFFMDQMNIELFCWQFSTLIISFFCT
ncbi:CASP-like protein 4A2 isoform X2 [Carica papaya]|uniref:CASP-like protein 4A2 isoform X2 n=1 Tax=Carica papaya TaxID=3649 RepID=UPI000B8D0C3A|nr:CASP-like protein 4A2 isoform X2 [Carica papaya]